LGAAASEAKRFMGMPTGELAGEFGAGGGSGLVGMFAGVGAKTANKANLEIAQKLKEFMDRGPLTDIQRQGQFSMILGRYNWDNIAQKTMDVYRLLVGKKEV
jgi:hypothetical protein